MAEVLSLPPLRQELGLFPAPIAADGAPAWTLHDPPANKFYALSWPAFEILSRWHLGSVPEIVAAVNRETTLNVSEQDVLGMIAFLEQNFLLQIISPAVTQRLLAVHAANRPGWALWLLKNYLFIRIPLIRPQKFLRNMAPLVAGLFTRTFFFMALIAAGLAAVPVSRQWELFLHSFTAYRGLEGLIALGCTVPLAKIVHEFGHAFTAYRYGCRIPSMGFAFVVLTPMLYTDTNEAWKLTSHTRRLAVGVAGMAAELLLALLALWAWILLPDGPMRAAAFVLATTTWIMTLALNASPFMRFDGYFILSDILGLPNLHQRAFAFGRWWLREVLFGLNAPPPEPARPQLRVFLVFFAFATWLYRLVVFFGIALLVYRYFFKALGILLFMVEIGWFILLPMAKEMTAWWKLREQLRWNRTTFRSALLIAASLLPLMVPWQGQISAPAVLSASREQMLAVPFASLVEGDPVKEMRQVHAGEVLLQLHSPEMAQQVRQVEMSTETSRLQTVQQAFDRNLLNRGKVLHRRYASSVTELAGLRNVMGQLTLHAPFDGVIVAHNDELAPGVWLARKEPLFVIADLSGNRADAYVEERDQERIKAGGSARFIPDALEYGGYECRVAEIDQVNVPSIDEPFLASVYGGPLASRRDGNGAVVPETPLFRIRMDRCNPGGAPPLKLKGIAHIEAEKRSLLLEALRHAYAVILREISF